MGWKTGGRDGEEVAGKVGGCGSRGRSSRFLGKADSGGDKVICGWLEGGEEDGFVAKGGRGKSLVIRLVTRRNEICLREKQKFQWHS